MIIKTPILHIILAFSVLSSCNEAAEKEMDNPEKQVNEEKKDSIVKPHVAKEIPFYFTKGEDGKYELVVSEYIKIQIEKFNPDFELYSYNDFVKTCGGLEATYFQNPNPPFATIGDFNADGMEDIALFGYDKEKTIFMAMLSNAKKSSFTFTNFIVWDYWNPKEDFLDVETNIGLSVYVFTEKRSGEIDGRMQEVDQIIIEHCGKASQGFYFEGTNMKTDIVSD